MIALSLPETALIIVEVAVIALWVWMFIDFWRNRDTFGRTARITWLVCFILTGTITAILYFFLHYTKDE
jgi:hypothetical protein